MSLDQFDANEGMSLEDIHHDVLLQIEAILSVSYTHLTLPTIYSV